MRASPDPSPTRNRSPAGKRLLNQNLHPLREPVAWEKESRSFAIGAKRVVVREQQKERRRQQILDAAELLIRETNATSFTMLELARRARLSPTTPYNLFGSKGGILYTLLNRALDRLVRDMEEPASGAHPVDRAVLMMVEAANFFTSDPTLFRALYQYQLGEWDPVNRPEYMDKALEYWRRTLDDLAAAGFLVDGHAGDHFGREEMARALISHSIGLLDLWVQEELADEAFRAQMAHDAALLLFAAVDGKGQERLMEFIREARPHIAPRISFRTSSHKDSRRRPAE
jgi:AcrR family transcriptional regulator